jgi:hypothetical protein
VADENDIKIKYLSAKAKRQNNKLDFHDAVEYHEALIVRSQLEILRLAQELGKLKAEIENLKKEK